MNSVDPNEFNNSVRSKTENFIIIYNGTIVKLLNLGMIIEAIAKLKTEMPPEDYNKIIFKLYGEGPALN